MTGRVQVSSSSFSLPSPSLPTLPPSLQSKDSQFTYEVIIVNDGSTDDTSKVALKYVEKFGVEKVRLLDFTHNRGKGGAVRMVRRQ